jgi:hypothetical protein
MCSTVALISSSAASAKSVSEASPNGLALISLAPEPTARWSSQLYEQFGPDAFESISPSRLISSSPVAALRAQLQENVIGLMLAPLS